MALFDLSLHQLRHCGPESSEPADFDAFWKRTLNESAICPIDPEFQSYDSALSAAEVYDVTFSGWGGHRIRATVFTAYNH
ncbi:acetylxylan esterase [Streptomyces sp. NPDC051020]|uniref:acetylxylan esterase n=1 Tax=Streptomyces sp. NPDC051020 TaxID=3155409 RepID=UPI003439A0E5